MLRRMLTPYFSLEEMIFSQTAVRKDINNTPTAAIIRNLNRLAQELEVVRAALDNFPVIISSGYRSPQLNRAVGGSTRSAHMTGLAVDFTVPRFGTVLQTARAVAASGIDFDQIIYEFGRWVHLGLAADGSAPRQELLSIKERGKYVSGLKNL